ncbi:extradiol dioxygenase [Salinibacterium hongtaonis]|uniref:Extradiol dioxygenase n=1 Tax=Homoserinimonas hongtaonis TaxID=2079791 RepID=A0A2U1T3U2_9MICO|nr:extradiol dioxygenase [Salinibacterium hongtaonis]PWB98510.1 extradiol dioxygenase [Salinibacterium hongtaonis]
MSVYSRTPRPRPIRVPKLHHATFMTMEIDPMVRFYEAVCGLQPVFYSEHAAWLTNDEANHRIALLRIPGTKPPVDKPHTAGLHHTAFEYEDFDAWLDNYARLRDMGIMPAFCMDHGMTMSIYYNDPDGNGIEIQIDNFRDWGKSTEWMWASREFAEDQLGPQFDPDLLLEARAQGASPDEIHERAYAGEFRPAVEVPNPSFPDVWVAKLAANPSLANGVPFPGMPQEG